MPIQASAVIAIAIARHSSAHESAKNHCTHTSCVFGMLVGSSSEFPDTRVAFSGGRDRVELVEDDISDMVGS